MEQLRFEKPHKALIGKTTWEIVQHIRQHKRRRTKHGGAKYFLRAGVLHELRRHDGATQGTHHGCGEKQLHVRATYKKKDKDKCSAHYIRESQLAEIILHDLRRVTPFARQNELLFAEHITQKNSGEVRRAITQTERELETMRRRDTELTALFKRLYEDNVLGKIPIGAFRKLSDDYFAEPKKIQSSIPDREERLETLKSSVANASVFLEKAKEYTQLDTLTAAQEIHIYYRDIGLLGDLNALPTESAAVPESQEVA